MWLSRPSGRVTAGSQAASGHAPVHDVEGPTALVVARGDRTPVSVGCPGPADREDRVVNTYRVHIRSDEFEYEHEVRATDVEKEDGWTIFWSGNDVFMRIRDDHIVSLEHLI